MADLQRSAVTLADGTALDVLSHTGAADAPVLVYVHDFAGLDPDLGLLEALSEDATVHAPVFRSFASMEDVPLVQRQCSELITRLGLDRPMLAGHGAGAAVAAEMAAMAPIGFSHLFMIAPVGMNAEQRPISGEGMEHRLAQIQARTTLIRGKQDETVSMAAILNLARLMVGSSLITVPESGNDVVATRTDAVARGFAHGLRVSGGS
ncbi:MAG: hypothetical protein P1U65_01580 [Minwuia sp.]|nr:hypothetical protein [Minwuia sp.]